MTNKSDIKIVLISFALLFFVKLIFVVVDTVLAFSEIELAAPSFLYFLYGYFPLAVTGFYIGWTKTNSKMKICALASLFYVFKMFYFDGLLENDVRHNYIQYKFMIALNLAVLSFLIMLGANTLSQQIKKIKKT